MTAALENCLEEDVLAELVYARLSPAEAAAAEAHIDACAACRTLLAELLRQRTPSVPSKSAAGSLSDVASHELPPRLALDAVLPPGTRIGRFFVREQLGHGGMGVVYVAYDKELARDVALKLVRPRRRRLSQPDVVEKPPDDGTLDRAQLRLLREAQAMARLSHPNVRAVYEVGVIAGQVYIAMELVNGISIREHLHAARRSLGEILTLFLQAGQGLLAAHQAGLLHRDVKPDNILVSGDKRVRITDFGLARSDGPHDSLESDAGCDFGSPTALPLTQTGMALGTPGYIAPEQLRGEAIDARADQWSFCATLYEALYDERPFQGSTVPDLLAAIERGPRWHAKARAVPAWLRQVLRRGLSFDKEARFPSLAALLSQLDRAPRQARARKWMLAAGLAGAGLAALAGTVYLGFVRPERLCTQAARRQLAQAWSPDRRSAIERGLLARNLPYGRDTLHKVVSLLDAYSDRWLGVADDLCQSSRPRRVLPEATLLLRTQCLDLRRRELSALTSALLLPDTETIERAVAAASSLSGLDTCRNDTPKAIRSEAQSDAAQQARIDLAYGELVQARTLQRTGHSTDALKRLGPVMAAVKPLNQRALWAELALLRGSLEFDGGQLQAAEASLQDAVLAAEASGQDEPLAMAWLKLVEVGTRAARLEQAEGYYQHAAAVTERLGGDLHLAALRENMLAMLRLSQGRRAEALQLQTRAVALLGQSGASSLETAKFLTNLGAMQFSIGQHPDALVSHRRALALFESELGPNHPSVGNALLNLGAALGGSGDEAGEIAAYRRCIAIWEPALGKQHPNLAPVEQNLGTALQILGQKKEALAHFERALSIKRLHLPADHPSVASSQFSIGAMLHRLGRSTDGLRSLHDALKTFEARLGSSHPLVGKTLTEIGLVQLDLKKPALALPILERALHTGADADIDPIERAETRFGLARALRLVGREPDRAIALARQALRDYQGPEYEKEQAEISAWLAQ